MPWVRAIVPGLFFLCLAACSGGPADGASANGGRTGERDAGSAERDPATGGPLAPEAGPGCSATPSCDDKDSSGKPCLAACRPECQTKYDHYGFWVTPYEVGNTQDWGRHQGIDILGLQLAYDERFPLSDHAELLAKMSWPERPSFPGAPPDVVDKMMKDGAFRPYAMCMPPSLTVDHPLYNHGRTMSKDPDHAASRIEIGSIAANAGQPAWSDRQSFAPGGGKWKEAMTSCMTAIPDGYCDTMCGNCSYVLPSASLALPRIGDWSDKGNLVWGNGGCEGDESVFGGPGMMSRPSILGNPLPNPFTHCAWQGCAVYSYEAPSIDSFWSQTAVASGRYGHNSNTDAEAAFLAFQACPSPSADTVASICKACGNGVERQRPCADGTNTAASYWTRTARDFTGPLFYDVVTPVRDPMAGKAAPTPPQCRWGNFLVHGM